MLVQAHLQVLNADVIDRGPIVRRTVAQTGLKLKQVRAVISSLYGLVAAKCKLF